MWLISVSVYRPKTWHRLPLFVSCSTKIWTPNMLMFWVKGGNMTICVINSSFKWKAKRVLIFCSWDSYAQGKAGKLTDLATVHSCLQILPKSHQLEVWKLGVVFVLWKWSGWAQLWAEAHRDHVKAVTLSPVDEDWGKLKARHDLAHNFSSCTRRRSHFLSFVYTGLFGGASEAHTQMKHHCLGASQASSSHSSLTPLHLMELSREATPRLQLWGKSRWRTAMPHQEGQTEEGFIFLSKIPFSSAIMRDVLL